MATKTAKAATTSDSDAAKEREELGAVDRATLRAPNGNSATGAQGGVVDNMSARSDADALQGHFVKIDLNHEDIDGDLRESGRDYGVYLEPATCDRDTGYPITAIVQLRDETNARVVVPYEALKRSEAGHR